MTESANDHHRDEITRLLSEWQDGDGQALEQVSEIIYAELKRLARGHMAGERPGHTLQTTALVGEAYLRLMIADVAFEDRRHFMVVASRMMRRVLIDHARSRQAAKRGNAARAVTLDDATAATPAPAVGVLDLDDALNRLAVFDERKATILELQYFGGLPVAEVAEILESSKRTIEREATLARAWLQSELA